MDTVAVASSNYIDVVKLIPKCTQAVVVEIDERYGGIERYLTEKVGIDDGIQRRLREVLLVR